MSGLDSNSVPNDSFFDLAVIFIILATIAVVLRLWSRTVGQDGSFGADDWVCLAALTLMYLHYSNVIVSTYAGLAPGVKGLPSPRATVSPKAIITTSITAATSFGPVLALVKTSALCFYRRIFRGQALWFRVSLLVGHGLVFTWFVFNIVGISIDLQLFYKHPGSGLNLPCCGIGATLYLLDATMDALTDLYILVLPVPLLWKLNMRNKMKTLVILAFFLGYGVFITSLGRLILTVGLRTSHTPFNITDTFRWILFEPGLGVISICVPSWWPLIRRAREHGFRSLFTRRRFQRDESQVMAAARERERRHEQIDARNAADRARRPTLWSRLTSVLRETTDAHSSNDHEADVGLHISDERLGTQTSSKEGADSSSSRAEHEREMALVLYEVARQ